MSDEMEFDGHKFKETHLGKKATPEEREEALARFHDELPPKRCHVCWNLESLCRCARAEAYTEPAEEIISSLIAKNLHPSLGRLAVAGVGADERDRMLDAYAERGIAELERLVNDS